MLKTFSRSLIKKYSRNERYIRQLDALVHRINEIESLYVGLSDSQLHGKTQEFKDRLAQGFSLDSLLVEAFATVREAAKRTLGQRHFDVQLKGGIVLHRGMIAEMKTGEGKTLVATLPVYLNALMGKGVHVVTVNDYLAQRDSAIMKPIYEFLGLSVGCIIQDLTNEERRTAYHSDITYGTNNEFGFDYLRDNMKFSMDELCQRPFCYAIVDEVDSILIDEARTPLIISGPAEDSSDLYTKVNDLILNLNDEHYEKDEKQKSISFTDKGYEHIEHLVKTLGLIKNDQLFHPQNLMLVHHLNQALKAQKMYHRDIDYIVTDRGAVVIIDEFTGRMMKGRRYSDGLHQALEAKEGVEIEAENQTLASITFQNYFRMYPKLSGMTGTAQTEAHEFESIYKLNTVVIPTNEPVMRKDEEDEIFRTFEHKKCAIVKQIKACRDRNQPVLVGTASIEKSEIFSLALQQEGIPHTVLNARQHQLEAGIIAKAGMPGAVTIATNMAGRGTDIKLGGNLEVQLAESLEGIEAPDERMAIEHRIRQEVAASEALVKEAGGLFVLGTERHESRRIDNQLRGRSGRQGDPGASKFFISLEDDLMRIFGPNLKLMNYSLQKNEQQENEPIMHPWLTRAIEKAQQRVEAQHFDTRKHLLKYADVLNAQRKAVYDERIRLMELDDIRELVHKMVLETIGVLVDLSSSNGLVSDLHSLQESVERVFHVTIQEPWIQEGGNSEFFKEKIEELVWQSFEKLEETIGHESMRRIEKTVLLRTLDAAWIAHLNSVENLRHGIHLQAYGQKDPLNEYKNGAFLMFKSMAIQWKQDALSSLFQVSSQYFNFENYEEEEEGGIQEETPEALHYEHPSVSSETLEEGQEKDAFIEDFLKRSLSEEPVYMQKGPVRRKSGRPKKIIAPDSRNAICPCGSELRYKHCHGKPS
jgi:preprotein translocase subunit SecA